MMRLVQCYVALRPQVPKYKPKETRLEIRGPITSYSGVPKENDRIKVYARKEDGTFAGIYPADESCALSWKMIAR